MSDYSFLVNPGGDIYSEVNISRFVPNRLKKSKDEIEFKIVIYTQKITDVRWLKLDEVYFKGENNIQLKSVLVELDTNQTKYVDTVFDMMTESGFKLSKRGHAEHFNNSEYSSVYNHIFSR